MPKPANPKKAFEISAPDGDLTEQWWDWALHMQTNDGNNAFEDQTGDFASLGAVHPNMFFVAGAMGSTYENQSEIVLTRGFDVRVGTDILIPVFNIVESLQDYAYYAEDPDATPDDVVSFLENYRENWVTSVFCIIDEGTANERVIIDIDRTDPTHVNIGEEFYVQSDFFSLGEQKIGKGAEKTYSSFQPGELGYDTASLRPQDAVHDPAMSGGWWVLLENLSLGPHTIRFGGTLNFDDDPEADFTLDITDTINVVSSWSSPPPWAHASEHALVG
ncbi:hypothetical protein [Falsiroseomonas oryzae]|uniref:hypothetical protein n=1 Tax=Falsiroseomonas oryzae TaxID=2766473 RepID=UPI0022EA8832|nr:hypothetical protein [Roseomonas sp. MO-31]